MLTFSRSVLDLEAEVGQLPYPPVAYHVQFDDAHHIGQRIVVRIDSEMGSIKEVVSKFFAHCPL